MPFARRPNLYLNLKLAICVRHWLFVYGCYVIHEAGGDHGHRTTLCRLKSHRLRLYLSCRFVLFELQRICNNNNLDHLYPFIVIYTLLTVWIEMLLSVFHRNSKVFSLWMGEHRNKCQELQLMVKIVADVCVYWPCLIIRGTRLYL